MINPAGIATRAALAIRINDGPTLSGTLSIDRNNQVVWSDLPEPDPRWRGTDSNGHFHARAKDGTYPTLKTRVEHVECDGSCGGTCDGEGYTVTHYDCMICGEEVKPGLIPGPNSTVIPGLPEWSVKVVDTAPSWHGGEQVTVRIERDGVLLFGVAQVYSVSSDMHQVETELVGISPLGEQS